VTTQTLRTDLSADARAVAVRSILFVLILLLAWVSVDPFPNLDDPRRATIGDTADLVNQFAYVALAGSVAIYFLVHESWRLRPLVRPVYFAMLAWLAVSVATSVYPALSARRLIFAVLVIFLAAALPLLPSNLKRFCDLLAVVVIAILALCYAGVLLVPQLSIHQATDAVEPLLAGNWRGIFAHKNIAGVMMVNFIFFGLFIAKARNAIVGWPIVLAAGVFLYFAEAKSATALLPLVLVLSWAVERARSPALGALLLLAPLIIATLFTIGSLHFEAIREINEAVLSDPTFTGRNDIWQFALDHIGERPWLGHGFGAYWETPISYYQTAAVGSQATAASHAHNAFLDLAITIGIVGLLLAVLWTMVLPFLDFQRCKNAGAQPDLTRMFLRVWMFALYTCSFESVLFNRGDPHWFTMLVAMFGLRYLSVSRLKR